MGLSPRSRAKLRAASFLDEAAAPRRVLAETTGPAFSEVAELGRHNSRQRGLANRVTLCCAVFAVAAFGGGLTLARFSSSSPQRIASVRPIPPEVFYSPLEFRGSDLGGSLLQQRTPGSVASQQMRSLRDASRPETNALPMTPAAPLDEIPRSNASEPADELNIDAIAATYGESARYALVARAQTGADRAEPLRSGYEAVQIAPIPEPSSWLIFAAFVAAVIGREFFKRRRVHS